MYVAVLNVVFSSKVCTACCPERACVVSFVAFHSYQHPFSLIVGTVCFQVTGSKAVSISFFSQCQVLLSISKEYVNKFEPLAPDLHNVLS